MKAYQITLQFIDVEEHVDPDRWAERVMVAIHTVVNEEGGMNMSTELAHVEFHPGEIIHEIPS